MLPKTALSFLLFTALIQFTVLATPFHDEINTGSGTEAHADHSDIVERVMSKLLQKHKDFIKRHMSKVDSTNVRDNAETTGDTQPAVLKISRQTTFGNDMRIQMMSITDKDIKSIKQNLRRKYPEALVSALDTNTNAGEDTKSLLLYFTNE